MSWIPPKSPYNLIQERLWNDLWKIFVDCMFCNLTKRVESEPYMWKFFNLYASHEKASKANPDKLKEMIRSLGLSQISSKALIQMSNDYLIRDWKDRPELLYEVGKYGSDAYKVFCIGRWNNVEQKDCALINYHAFLKSTTC